MQRSPIRVLGSIVLLLFLAVGLSGCATITSEPTEESRSSGQALEQDSKSCEDECMEEFHACKNSPDRGGGPGASACAKEKNRCKKRC